MRCNNGECKLPRKQVQRKFKELYLPVNGYFLDVADEVVLVQLLDAVFLHGNLYTPFEFEGREVRVFKYS